jgi:N-glycosylase/DNA lyase
MKEHCFGSLWKEFVSYSMNRRAKEGLKHCDKYFTSCSFRRFLLKLLDTTLLIRMSPDTECANSISGTKKLRLLEETDGSESRK